MHSFYVARMSDVSEDWWTVGHYSEHTTTWKYEILGNDSAYICKTCKKKKRRLDLIVLLTFLMLIALTVLMWTIFHDQIQEYIWRTAGQGKNDLIEAGKAVLFYLVAPSPLIMGAGYYLHRLTVDIDSYYEDMAIALKRREISRRLGPRWYEKKTSGVGDITFFNQRSFNSLRRPG